MFFIGVFGIENKEKKIKDMDNVICRKCNVETSVQLIKSYNYFHFFFIPIFKWNMKYYLVCDNCKTIHEIPIKKGKDIEKGERNDINYWDMKVIYRGYQKKVCTSCMNEVEEKYIFCPYCGNRIKDE